MKIEFFVPGEPKPQGSKDQFMRESCKLLPAWRSLVSVIAKEKMGNNPPTDGLCQVRIVFVFSRPKSHYKTGKYSNVQKPGIPHGKGQKPDLDKLQRAIFDAMTGIVFKDDSQVWAVDAVKIFGDYPGAEIQVQMEEK